MQDFFELVWGDGDGYVCIVTADSDGVPNNNKFFKYPEQLNAIVKYAQLHSMKDVWFTPALFNSPESRRQSNAKELHTLYADADTFDIDNFKLEPSIIVQTSPNKTHCYWTILDAEDYDIVDMESANHAISLEHPKAETGLDNGWSITKILRVPQTNNLKYKTPFRVKHAMTGVAYTYNEFIEQYDAELARTGEYNAEKMPSWTEINSNDAEAWDKAIYAKLSISSEVKAIIDTKYNTGKRSEMLFLAINELMEFGATNEEVFRLLHNKPVDKWSHDHKRTKAAALLWEDVVRTRTKKADVLQNKIKEIAESDAPERLETLENKISQINLMDASERPKRTFIDKFVAWSNRTTNAAEDYKIAAAFIVLSTVFSDFGHINMRWGRTPLHLWYIISGGTTEDRKSTAKNQALRILRKLEHYNDDNNFTFEGIGDTEYAYDYSSDFSSEGMADTLLQRPNRSGVVTRDEFQGLLAEISGKNYKAGLKEALTDWYDGRISARIRSGQKQKGSGVNFSLSFYAIGIADQIIDNLTTEDFASGFLPRFLWVDPVSSKKQQRSITDGFMQGSADPEKDDEFVNLVKFIQESRDYWEDIVDPEGETVGLPFEDDAWERLVNFMSDMETAARKINKDALPSVERLTVSTAKCAALLAMADCADKVTLDYVVTAIYYAEVWFKNMLGKISIVSSTLWKKQQDAVLSTILAEGTMSYKKLYNRWRHEYMPRDFSDILRALEDSGHIYQWVDDKQSSRLMVSYAGIEEN